MPRGQYQIHLGAMRFAYDDAEDLMPLLNNPDNPRFGITDLGGYSAEKFAADLLMFNGGALCRRNKSG